MEKADAYRYHDVALDYLHGYKQERDVMLESAEPEAAREVEDVRIAVAVEETEEEARVALRVRKLDEATLAAIDDMRARGVVPEDTEVEEIGPLYGFGPGDMVSPLQPGIACSHSRGQRGTVGCILTRGVERLLLSANHVLAREGHSRVDDEIVQPAAGAARFRSVGRLLDFEPLKPLGNLMDAAVARLTVGDVDPVLFNGKRVVAPRTAPLKKGDRLFKFGQSTEEGHGTMLSITSNVTLQMHFDKYAFDSQIEVESTQTFSCMGDSGALVYDEDDLAVGILIGGNCGNRTYVTPIALLLDRFHAVLA